MKNISFRVWDEDYARLVEILEQAHAVFFAASETASWFRKYDEYGSGF